MVSMLWFNSASSANKDHLDGVMASTLWFDSASSANKHHLDGLMAHAQI
jgi:hypothetical protein